MRKHRSNAYKIYDRIWGSFNARLTERRVGRWRLVIGTLHSSPTQGNTLDLEMDETESDAHVQGVKEASYSKHHRPFIRAYRQGMSIRLMEKHQRP